jgi:hypothetical protein
MGECLFAEKVRGPHRRGLDLTFVILQTLLSPLAQKLEELLLPDFQCLGIALGFFYTFASTGCT